LTSAGPKLASVKVHRISMLIGTRRSIFVVRVDNNPNRSGRTDMEAPSDLFAVPVKSSLLASFWHYNYRLLKESLEHPDGDQHSQVTDSTFMQSA
jgi:hypothetical protein